MFTTTREKRLWNRPTTVIAYFNSKDEKVPTIESAQMNDNAFKVWSKELLSLSKKKMVKSAKAHEPRPYCYTITKAEFEEWEKALLETTPAETAKPKKASAKKDATTKR